MIAFPGVPHIEITWAVFEILRSDIAATFYIIPNLIQSIVAIERIGDFLYNVGFALVLLSAHN